jgi:hypothetical protein
VQIRAIRVSHPLIGAEKVNLFLGPVINGQMKTRAEKALWRIKLGCLCWFMIAAAWGSSREGSRTDINPALLYYQAFLLAPEPMSEMDQDYLQSREGAMQKLPQRYEAIFHGYDNEFQLVRQAARAKVACDWGIDLTAGSETLLPQLARAKAVMQATRLRVMWELDHDRQAEARDDLLAAFRLARHVPQNELLISVLVQTASEALNCATVAENFGRFNPETLKELADGIDAIPRVSVARCVAAEKEFGQNWLRLEIERLRKEYPGNDAKVMEGIHAALQKAQSELGTETNTWDKLSKAAGGTSDGLLKLAQQASFADRIAAVLALPHGEYETQLERLKAEVAKSPNPLVPEGLRQFDRARQREFRGQVYLAMVRAAVEYRLHGEVAFQKVQDPWAKGPFAFRRFTFEGVDRGFELKSAYKGQGFEEAMIFVEKQGPAFAVNGVPGHVGKSRPSAKK